MDLFKSSTNEHLAIGEASVYYLYSPLAVRRLLKFNPHALMIAMIRNPIDMAYSYHSQMLWNAIEDVEDFPTAWALQAERKAGRKLPKGFRYGNPRLDMLRYFGYM